MNSADPLGAGNRSHFKDLAGYDLRNPNIGAVVRDHASTTGSQPAQIGYSRQVDKRATGGRWPIGPIDPADSPRGPAIKPYG